MQVASKKVAKKGDGFDVFGKPDPFNQNDDDQVDAGEPNAPAAENPNDDAYKVSDDGDSDDVSFVQVASKKVAKKGDGFNEFRKPAPFNQNHDDQVDAGEPNAPAAENPNDEACPRRTCRSLNGCGNFFTIFLQHFLVPKDSKIIVCVGFGKCPNGKSGRGGGLGERADAPPHFPPQKKYK